MGCLIAIFALLTPRVVLLAIAIGTNWFSQAFQTTVWPVLGWFFMPYTTLAYMGAMLRNNHEVSGWWLVALIVGVVLDLASNGAGANRQRQ